jgi:hypothetical protein
LPGLPDTKHSSRPTHPSVASFELSLSKNCKTAPRIALHRDSKLVCKCRQVQNGYHSETPPSGLSNHGGEDRGGPF